jgi:hypothetical protein
MAIVSLHPANLKNKQPTLALCFIKHYFGGTKMILGIGDCYPK